MLLSVLEIPLDKELTDDCHVETHTKLEELIPAVMVKYGLTGYTALLVVVAVHQ